MRNKLLEAIKPLQLNTNDKNKLVNTIIDIGNSGGGGGGAVSQYAPRYFKIDLDKASEDWKKVLYINPNIELLAITIGSTYRQRIFMHDKEDMLITAHPIMSNTESTIYFSYIPVYIPQSIINHLGVDMKAGFYSFEDIIINLPILAKIVDPIDINLSMEGITEITEEEFYKID